jgi:chitinase
MKPEFRKSAYYMAVPGKADRSPIDTLNWGDIDRINYGFAMLNSDGSMEDGQPDEDVLNRRALSRLRESRSGLEVLVSLGGWEWSRWFSDVAVDPAARQRLCTAAASYIREYGFDGIDLDWEYPSGGGHPHNTRRPEDPENYRILMLELRDALDRAAANAPGRRYLISAAAAAAPERVAPVDYRRFSDVYDRINLMSYDYFGEWDARCGHQANLQAADKSGAAEKLSGERAVAAYREAGFEALQIHFGLPLYARSWITDDPHALPGSAALRGAPPLEVPYRILRAIAADPAASAREDTEAEAGWIQISEGDLARILPPQCIDSAAAESGLMRVISWDSPEILGRKAAWARSAGLGGIFTWEISLDDGTFAEL